MTKKHFEAIASIIECNLVGKHIATPEKQLENLAEDLADYFQTIEPRFKRDRFLTACGIEQS